MTRDEILNMPAGREMDALIAERLMGWTLMPLQTLPRSNLYSSFPKYSTDITAAWEVVDKLRRTWASININCEGWDDPGDGWYMRLGAEGKHVAYADTAPLAICRAALLAVMETA